MLVVTVRLGACFLAILLITFAAARPPARDETGTGNGNRHRHVTATRTPFDVANAQIARPSTTADDSVSAADSPCNDDKQTGSSKNRKHKCSEVRDGDWNAAVGSQPLLFQERDEWAADERQRRSADWANRKKYGSGVGRWRRNARDMVAVGWNKRPRYYREDGTTRDWRTNMMRVWGKRNVGAGARLISGSGLMTSPF